VIAPLRKLLYGLWQYPVPTLLTLVLLALIGLAGMVAHWFVAVELHYRDALHAIERRDFEQARVHLAAYLEVWKTSAETHFLAARTARRAGAYDDAERHLNECQKLGWVDEAIDLERQLLRAQRGDLASVEGGLLYFVQQNHPDYLTILEALTWGYIKTYNLSKASHCLELWLERQPDDIQALMWRGDVRERRLNYHDALLDFRRVVELDPQRDNARLRVAEMLLSMHQTDEAAREFERLHERQPENTAVLLGLARCRRLQARPDEARQMLDGLLDKGLQSVGVLSERGKLEMETGHPDSAERWLRKAVEQAPYERETAYSLYLCLQQLRHVDEAKKILAKLNEIDKQLKRLREITQKIGEKPDPSLRFQAGLIFLRSGQEREGVRWLQSALQEDPHYQPARLALADYFEKAGDSVQAAWHRRLAGQEPGSKFKVQGSKSTLNFEP
jgi:tetratricopeptide (TPR) repeat protein